MATPPGTTVTGVAGGPASSVGASDPVTTGGDDPEPGPGLRLRLLGPLEAERDGRLVDLGSPKQQTVLALLAVHANTDLSVDRIMDELWGDAVPSSGLATLQAYISNLRRALEPGRASRSAPSLLMHRLGAYRLVIPDADLDVRVFEQRAALGAGRVEVDPRGARDLLVGALALWRGPALAEFAAYDFAVAEASRLEELRITTIECRVAADLQLVPTPASGVVAELEQLVAVHPLRERLWRHLMHAYYLTGRQAEALRAFRRCQHVLAEELGLSPSPELAELEHRILEHDPTLFPPTTPSRADTGKEPVPPIVGRAAEVGEIIAALDAAATGRGSLFLVSGEAGIGKTRLLDHVAALARGRGCATATARCIEVGGTPPFWPWIQIARALGTEALEADAARLAPLLGDDGNGNRTTGLSAGPGLHLLAAGLTDAFRELAAVHPVVVVIDDLSSADPDSLALLALLAAGVESERLVIVASHRGTGVPRRHPLTETLAQLSRLEATRRIRLRPLTGDEVAELVRTVVDDQVDAETVSMVQARSDGNAFFAKELARLILERGAGAHEKVPDTVREIIELRLADMTPTERRLVRAAAVAGRTFDLAVVARSAGVELSDVLALADAAVASGLVEELSPPGRYRFVHVLVVETVIGALGALRRAQIHNAVADALEALHPDDPGSWDAIAHHRTEAIPVTGPAAAVESLARAGRRAVRQHALELADQLFDRRHRIVMSAPPSAERDQAELASILDRAPVLTWRHGYQGDQMAQAAWRMVELTRASSHESMLDPTTETGLRHGALQALQARCSLEIVGGRIAASEATVDTMLALADRTDSAYVGAVASVNAMVVTLHAGRISEALNHCGRAEELLPAVDPGIGGQVTLPLGQQSLAVTSLCFAGWVRWLAGQDELSDGRLREGRLVADRIDHDFSRAFHASIESIVAISAADPERAQSALAWGSRTREKAERFGFIDDANDMYRVWADGAANPRATARRLRDSIRGLDAQRALVVRTLHWAMVAELEIAAGRPEKALDAANSGIERALAAGEMFWYPELERLRSTAYAVLGRAGDAAEAHARGLAAAVAMGSPPLIARLEGRPGGSAGRRLSA